MHKMEKEKMMKMGAPDVDAKKDVLKALRKMAMQMMAEGSDEGEDGAVVAKLQMQKLEPKEMGEEVELEEGEELPEMSEEGMEDELDPREVLELLKQAK